MMDFCGKPLFLWSVEQAKSSKLVDRVVVSTDDNEIAEYAYEAGTDIMRREKVSDTQTLEEVLYLYLAKEVIDNSDTVILLQPTSPLRLPCDIENALRHFRFSGFHSLFSCNLEDDLFLFTNKLEPVTFTGVIPSDYRRLNDNYYRENGSIYIMTNPSISYRNRYSGHLGFYPMQKWQSFEIDEPEDVEICEFFMKKYIIGEGK